jgi:preprotein translocase subunit SecF
MKYRWIPIAVSVAMFVAGLLIMQTKGLNYGIDFKGGARMVYQFKGDVTEGEIKEALAGVGLGGAEVVRYGEKADKRMAIKVEKPEEHAQLGSTITRALEERWGEGNVALEEEETVGPKVGKELRKKAWLAVIFAVILMLIYIGYRFDFLFAPGAVIALIHDVTITMGVFALLGKEFNLTILAALLTIVGYSINDTIIVFDRIRENRHGIGRDNIDRVVNQSLNQTLARTIVTSLTVIFVLVVIFIKGGGALHNFAFALIVGMVLGTYSSIFIASPCYVGMFRAWPKLKHALGKK